MLHNYTAFEGKVHVKEIVYHLTFGFNYANHVCT